MGHRRIALTAALCAATATAGCGEVATPETATLTLACRPTVLNTSRFLIPATDGEHLPERTTCTVTPLNVAPGAQIEVAVDADALGEVHDVDGPAFSIGRAALAATIHMSVAGDSQPHVRQGDAAARQGPPRSPAAPSGRARLPPR